MSRKSGIRFALAGAFCSTLLLLGACSAQDSHLPWKDLDAPGGILRIEYDDPPIFGSHTLYFSYLPAGSEKAQRLGSRELNNDGANLGDHNLEILDRTENALRFVLRGQQQEDVELVFLLKDGMASLSGGL